MALRDGRLLRQQCYLDGNWIDADNGAVQPINNPAIGHQLGTVPILGTAETRRAIAAAQLAFPGWRTLTAKQRSAIQRRWFELCMANQEDLATIMTLEQGKPLAESRGEIAYGSAFIEWFAEEGRRIYGDVIPANAGDRRIVVLKEPIGGGGNHAVELSQRDDRAQGGGRTRGRMHHGNQARSRDSFFCPCASRARRTGGCAKGGTQHNHGRRNRNWSRAVRESGGAQAFVHRVD